jgi:transcriptional regulator with XRE-family HTH domain
MKSNIGDDLRAARESRGWTLRAVAASVGISPSLLSQVETNKVNPSVSTLYALVTHLGISMDDLLGASGLGGQSSAAPSMRGGPIQRYEENPTIQMENGVTWERLAVGNSGQVDPLVTTYAPGGASSTGGLLMRHAGTEYGLLMEGELTLFLDFDSYRVRAGDSMCFDSTRPHRYLNHTASIARGLWFVLGESVAGEGTSHLAEHHRAMAEQGQ